MRPQSVRRPSRQRAVVVAVLLTFFGLYSLAMYSFVKGHSATNSPVIPAAKRPTTRASTTPLKVEVTTTTTRKPPVTDAPTAAPQHRSREVPSTAETPRHGEKRQPAPLATRPNRCAKHGANLAVKDNAVKEQPGGGEAEALQYRRELTRHQYDEYQHSSMEGATPSVASWRRVAAEKEQPNDCLTFYHASMKLSLMYDVATSHDRCAATDFRCRIASYDRQRKAQSPQSDTAEGRRCEEVYGSSLLKRFDGSRREICTPVEEKQHASSVTCKMLVAHHSHDVPTSVCVGSNVTVDYNFIADGDYPWLAFSSGALGLQNCNDHPSAHPPRSFMHCLADWMELGYTSAASTIGATCDVVVDTPTYFVTRSGDYSPFAMTHDWINSVILMAVEEINPQDIQLVMMDRMTVGFYTPVWQLSFSPSRPLQWYPDLRETFQGKRVCYRKAWFNIPARLSPIYNEDECGTNGSPFFSSIYLVYRDHILHSLGTLRTFAGPVDVAGREVMSFVVTVIMRLNYATGHPIGRRIGNADELTKALRRELLKSLKDGAPQGDGSGEVAVIVNQVDYASMDFDTQLNVSRSTDLLVAMHGAGLAQMMFQHQWGGAFEFFCPQKPSSNYRYHQLSAKMGIAYGSYSIANEDNIVPLEEAVPLVESLAVKVLQRKRKFLGA